MLHNFYKKNETSMNNVFQYHIFILHVENIDISVNAVALMKRHESCSQRDVMNRQFFFADFISRKKTLAGCIKCASNKQ